MPRRAHTTLVFITNARLVRADYSAGANPKQIGRWEQNRPDVEDAGLLLELALAMGPRPGQRTWLLTTDLWSGQVKLGAQFFTLVADELRQALAFEAEPISAIGALDSQLGYELLQSAGSEREFRVVQARNADLESLRDAAERARTRLAGVVHPAGLPVSLRNERGAWSRLEFWNDNVVAIERDEAGKIRMRFAAGDPLLGRWQASLADGRETTADEAVVETSRLLPAAPPGVALVNLEEATGLDLWLGAWAQELVRKTPAVPVVNPPRRPMSATQRLSLSACFALVALGLCAAHHQLVSAPAIAGIETEIRELKAKSEMLQAQEKSVKDLDAKRDETARRNEQLRQGLQALGVQRERLADFFSELARLRNDAMFIRQIDCSGGAPLLRGACMRPELVGVLAGQVAKLAKDRGWNIHTPKTTALHLAANGGPWEFELLLEDVLLPETKSPTAKKAGQP